MVSAGRQLAGQAKTSPASSPQATSVYLVDVLFDPHLRIAPGGTTLYISFRFALAVAMETLLSHSFDYLSSNSPQKIRKGLRQVEGLLAQLCLSKTNNA